MVARSESRTTFIGWQKPFPAAVADQLLARWPEMNFFGVTVVASGGRVGRRILALLADEARTRKLAMFPPRFITVGELPETLYQPTCPVAGMFLRQIAWASALRQTEDESIRPLFPRLNTQSDTAGLMGAANVLDRCNEELAAGMLRFDDVFNQAAARPGLGEPQRWQVAAQLHATYLHNLQSMGVCDRQQARHDAIESSAIRSPGPIILAGVAELSAQARAMLEIIEDQLEILVYAPPNLAGTFDRFGCVQVEEWSARPVDLSTANLRVAGTISEQAETVFAALAERTPPARIDDITIGAADESIVPHIETTAANLTGVPVRYGAGVLLSRTRPFQLLKVIADYLQTGQFAQFSNLVRHPDVEQFLRGESEDSSSADAIVRWRDWRTLLDVYAAEYLPLRVGPQCATPEGWRGQAREDESDSDDRADLAWLYRQIESLLGDLRKDNAATADQWAEPILAVLNRVYGRQFDQNDDRQRLVVIACLELRKSVEEMHAAGIIPDRSHFPPITGNEAIGGLMSLCAARRLPPPLTGREIEIVGWLELMPDDARHLVVTGFNEGFVPESSRTDPLLNETVREATHLACDRDRLARDAYLLTAILSSRPPGTVTLITGRRSSQGDPLLPSRLLFACDARTMAQHVLGTIELPSRRAPLALRFGSADRSAFRVGAAIPPGLKAPAMMSVTAFRDYLASPQGYYLKHMRKLSTLEESAPRELEPRQYGEILHNVLRKFAPVSPIASSSAGHCEKVLLALLDDEISQKFGVSLPGALRFQVEMMRLRLALIAKKQADWFAEGWKILHFEKDLEASSALPVDGSDMGLRGRIDRIDYNERLNAWAILDYKIAAGEKTPKNTHQSNKGWIDLQLPLYRHLARNIITDHDVILGYVVLSDQEKCTGYIMADWTDPELQSADETARQVVRDIRQCKFADIGENPPTDGIFAYIFGQGMLISDTDEPTEEQSA